MIRCVEYQRSLSKMRSKSWISNMKIRSLNLENSFEYDLLIMVAEVEVFDFSISPPAITKYDRNVIAIRK